MGEYAIYNGQRVKIGTCESMYYLRFEDRFKVDKEPHSLNPQTEKDLFWRLPFPDEDKNQPGSYDPFNRGQRLYKVVKATTVYGQDSYEEPILDLEPGTIQLRHECGLLLNVPCYHGARLPDVHHDQQVFWNGKSWFLELTSIKNCSAGTIRFVVSCKWCRGMWSFPLAEIQEWIPEGELKERLKLYR